MQKTIRTVLLLFAIFVLRSDAGEKLIANGQTAAEVMQLLGEPNGTAVKGNDTYLYYAGETIKLSGGVVTGLPEYFNATLKSAQKKEAEKTAFAREQKSKGLVLFDGAWIPKDEAATKHQLAAEKERALRALTVQEKQQERIEKQFSMGKLPAQGPVVRGWLVGDVWVDHRPLAVPGKVAVVMFRKKGAPVCGIYATQLKKLAKSDSCIALHQVDFTSHDDPIAQRYHVDKKRNYCVRVVDPEGILCSGPNDSVEMLKQYIAQAKNNIYKSAHQTFPE